MRRPARLSLALLATGAVAGLAASTSGTALAATPAGPVAHATAARPVPASTGHQLAQTLAYPPTNSQCLSLYGIHCYGPAQLSAAYGLDTLSRTGDTGKGRTIAVVDSFGSPTIANDLKVFDKTYGLKDPELQIIAPAGPIPAYDNSDDRKGWAGETTLDVEYAHVFAPDAKILLVETPVSETEGVQGFPEIVKAENYVIDHELADVISMSFGATEQTFPSPSALLALRGAFTNAARHGVTLLAASGDNGATDAQLDGTSLYDKRVNSWPSADPLVTSVGGTMLLLDDSGKRLAPDAVWNDGYGAGGGGVSSIFARPVYQTGVAKTVGPARGTPDVSLDAAVDGASVVYYSYDPARVGYHLIGGTSEATPELAGLVADAAQLRHGRLGNINSALYALSSSPTLASLSGIVDVTSGDNSFNGVTGYTAGPGYDLASGVGTVSAPQLVPALAATSVPLPFLAVAADTGLDLLPGIRR